MISVAFYKANSSLLDKAVAWWSNGPYSHCEVIISYVGEGLYLCASSSPHDGGVRFKEIAINEEEWDVVGVEGNLGLVQGWFVGHVGAKYDYLGLFGFVFRRGVQDQRRWFCSEAIAESLGYPSPWRYDPNTLFDLMAIRKAVEDGADNYS